MARWLLSSRLNAELRRLLGVACSGRVQDTTKADAADVVLLHDDESHAIVFVESVTDLPNESILSAAQVCKT